VARIALLIVVALVAAGCGSESEEAGSPTPTAECEPLSDAGLTQRLSPALESRETMYLTDVSLELDDCVERVVFEFEEGLPGPGFVVSYQPENTAKIEDGSGNPIHVAGAAFLVVRLTPAMTARIEGEDVTPTYTGPREINPPTEARFVRHVVKTGDFEAQVTWAIGIDRTHPFRTNATESQLVVEIGP
jgi:hypothetical protein